MTGYAISRPTDNRRRGIRGLRSLSPVFLALVATYLFFQEYLPPFKRIHLWSDIEGFHYPLQRFAFQALKAGRLPLWDPSMYCGMSFVANVQAALFYPPSWLMYAASWTRPFFSFKTLEWLVFAHNWLGFVLCYFWLRSRRLQTLACLFGAGVFAFGGYMVSQSMHVGVVTGLAWMPLGLWGIDDAVEERGWRALWKTALACAMCTLAGYPPTWVVFCATTFIYALLSRAHWRAAAGVCGAAALAVLIAMIQLAPAIEAHSMMMREEKYGGGAENWGAVLDLFVPNWLDFNQYSYYHDPHGFYLYLGLPSLFAILWILRRRRFGPYIQPAVVSAFCMVMATNPKGLVYQALAKLPGLLYVTQTYNFYEGIAAMAALATALGLHDFLDAAPRKKLSRWMVALSIVLVAGWSAREVWIRRHGDVFAIGVASAIQTAIALAFFSVAFWTLRTATGRTRSWLAAMLVIAAGIDYKVYGTRRMFNTVPGDVDRTQTLRIPAVGAEAAAALWSNRQYRVVTDEPAGPHAVELRMWGLATPQGFDPFLPAQYHGLIERWVKFRSNREFDVDLRNERMLQALGVRYVITHDNTAHEPQLAADPNYMRIGNDASYYRIYEYRHAHAPFGWQNGNSAARPISWEPERRAFHVASETGGRFFLAEQFYPGWTATVDGRPSTIERWNGAFQAVEIAPGNHILVFRFHSRFLPLGASISAAGLTALALLILANRAATTRERLPLN